VSAAWRPTKEQLQAAHGGTVPDVIAQRLDVLFCGINPGLYSAAVGHHFARPGNRFWPALHASGFTRELMSPFDERDLLDHKLGITNLVARATAGADELSAGELLRGALRLELKVARYKPRFVASLGLSAYRLAWGRPNARVGPQRERLGDARLWLLPNPSGVNAHYQVPDLAAAFDDLRRAVEQ
jgi:TDG/mug DNA glycosylase family protein